MEKRFVSIWFRHLATDWFSLRRPDLKKLPLVLRAPSNGRMVVTAANAVAESSGITKGMVLADARAIVPRLQVLDDIPDLPKRLLGKLAEWCIRFTPSVAVDLPDGLIFDATGCSHLWGGDDGYAAAITGRLNARGYDVRTAMADTPGSAWAIARFGGQPLVIPPGRHVEALMDLPPESLRLEPETVEQLHKLGLRRVRQFIGMPRSSLLRRFGPALLQQLDQATGRKSEALQVVVPSAPYEERLPCLEPITTLAGIEIAVKQLLEALCSRLQQEQKGLRSAALKCYRVDGQVVSAEISTSRPSHHVAHIFKLFELRLGSIEPALGIELFTLEGRNVEADLPLQEKMWEEYKALDDRRLSELIDRLAARIGMQSINRYMPDAHYWPERSFRPALALNEQAATGWQTDKVRPLNLLPVPEQIEVTAPIPDYPPMLFRHRGKLHKIVRADGPERIEQEWWLQEGQHRDYYCVEDEEGSRYWLFRLGHYHEKTFQWFLHGVFA